MTAPAALWQSNPPEQLLKDRFYIHTGFHPGQRDIIEQLVMGKRLLVIQRTGWGKSLCYQMASLYYPHLTLVFSPLKALMRDQCQRCNDSYGITAGMVSSEFSENFPLISPAQRIQAIVTHFLDEDFLPYIERYHVINDVVHEAGWSLSYHGWSTVGKLVRASKYENAGPFSLSLAKRAAELIKTRYPLHQINGIVSIPPTKSGLLVETFARRIASLLNLEYLPLLKKVRSTKEQKKLTNLVQKTENVKDAFSVSNAQYVKGRILLLIDDIYDSGCMLREASQTLMKAGVRAVYPLTITRTLHSDNR